MTDDDIAIATLVRIKTAIMAIIEARISTDDPVVAEHLFEALRHAGRAEALCRKVIEGKPA